MNWRKKLEKYLKLPIKQGDKSVSRDTLRYWLSPWVTWLGKKARMPTSQRLKDYLVERDYARASYISIGHAIERFTNHHLEKPEWIELIPPMGPAKRRAPFMMPDAVKDALTKYLREKLREYESDGGC